MLADWYGRLAQIIICAINDQFVSSPAVAPSRVRGLKQSCCGGCTICPGRTLTGAWIETTRKTPASDSWNSRTLTGAWIETGKSNASSRLPSVAPSRVRGLKPFVQRQGHRFARRTLTGAWIETNPKPFHAPDVVVAPSRVRGLKPECWTEAGWKHQSHPHGCVD